MGLRGSLSSENDSEIKAFFQKPFEDGSGIGWMNGFDGIWGLEYKNAKRELSMARFWSM